MATEVTRLSAFFHRPARLDRIELLPVVENVADSGIMEIMHTGRSDTATEGALSPVRRFGRR